MSERPQPVIRSMTVEELPLLHQLWDAAELDYRPRGRDALDQLQIERAQNPNGHLGAFSDDSLVGSVIATDDGRRGWINRLAVHPDFRGTGMGMALIEEAERVLEAQGRRIIAALIEDYNVHSQNLFQRAGYIVMPEVLYFSKRQSADV
ncbi:MAG: GNAT family N-acetyltransferase [candidate division Zixibacteria bacterium]|nr:GNAT family N-acetyltransferase [candidate division Zixibacteria bacterium]